jgi:hypothetical protein
MTSEVELKEIRSLLLELNKKVEGLNKLLKKNLVVCDDPLADEIEATKEYEASKKSKELQLIPWKRAAKGKE